jgi:hypothetical protein
VFVVLTKLHPVNPPRLPPSAAVPAIVAVVFRKLLLVKLGDSPIVSDISPPIPFIEQSGVAK